VRTGMGRLGVAPHIAARARPHDRDKGGADLRPVRISAGTPRSVGAMGPARAEA